MEALRLGKEARPLFDRAALRVRHGVIEAGDAGVGYRPGAHRTGFQRHPEVAAAKAEIAVKGGSLPKYEASVARVEVGKRKETVELPTVDVQKP